MLLDLGHTGAPGLLRQVGTRLFSADGLGHWVVFDTATRSELFSGDSQCSLNGTFCRGGFIGVDMGGDTILDASGPANTLRVLSGTTGQLLASISLSLGDYGSNFGVAADGSYVWLASSNTLRAWSRTGQALVDFPGNFAQAAIFAAPGELRVANGPAGADKVELISTTTGSATVTPAFLGTFSSWFIDGNRFLTKTGTTVRVYSSAGAFQDIHSLSTTMDLTGQGDYFWTISSAELDVYAVGGAAAPVFTTPAPQGTPLAAAGLIALPVAYGANSFDMVDLSGSTITKKTVKLAAHHYSFAADDAGNWSIGGGRGLVYDSSNLAWPEGPRPLDCGAAIAIAGSGSGRSAIATASGQVLYFNLQSGVATYEGKLDFPSSKVEMSDDGTVLAVSNGTVGLYSLPSGTAIPTWPVGTAAADFSLAAASPRIGLVTCCQRTLTDFSGVNSYFSDTYSTSTFDTLPLEVSPSGTMVAVPDSVPSPNGPPSTTIYQNGTLVGAVTGYPVGWIDDNRLLLGQWGYKGNYIQTVVSDPQGNVLATPPIPDPYPLGPLLGQPAFSRVGTTRIYLPRTNTIYALSDGSSVWTSPDFSQGRGAIAGSYVVFEGRSQVLAETH